MTRFLPSLAFLLGASALCWVGTGYIGHPLALAMTCLIAAFYVAGGLELRRYGRETDALAAAVGALSEAPPHLDDWLDRLPANLRNAVRLRIDGERVGLPAPTLTAYLVGLLVLLGMLGTFLGMVVTLDGTGVALAGATDVQAIRASLSAPVQGLGLAFGTSIAGVAASAMLGLVSALCRRDRLRAAQRLDTRIATTLRVFTPAQRREDSLRLQQQQALAMPALIDRLDALMATMARQGSSLHERLASGQHDFHEHARRSYADLAASVDRSLRDSLTESAHSASAAIQPVVEATMASIARETATLHALVEEVVQRQLAGFASRLDTHAEHVAASWRGALAAHQRAGEAFSGHLGGSLDRFVTTFESRSAALVAGIASRIDASAARVDEQWRGALALHAQGNEATAAQTERALTAAAATFAHHAGALLQQVDQSQAGLRSEIAASEQLRLGALTQALQDMAASLLREWQQAGAQATRQQQANAEVIAELRHRLSAAMASDNTVLEERTRLLDSLGTVIDASREAATEQRAAIDGLVGASADLLARVGSRFSETLDEQTDKMTTVAAQVTGSAAEVASLGEAFTLAVQLFGQSTEKLGAQLQRIEAALGKSTARSDEQLAYYVAQAREVIDLSIRSQKQIVEDLQRLADRRDPVGSEA